MNWKFLNFRHIFNSVYPFPSIFTLCKQPSQIDARVGGATTSCRNYCKKIQKKNMQFFSKNIPKILKTYSISPCIMDGTCSLGAATEHVLVLMKSGWKYFFVICRTSSSVTVEIRCITNLKINKNRISRWKNHLHEISNCKKAAFCNNFDLQEMHRARNYARR